MIAEWTHEDLRLWRVRLGLSQDDASKRLGLSLRAYSDRENGVSKISAECVLACLMIELGPTEEDLEMTNIFSGIRSDRVAQLKPGHLALLHERAGTFFGIKAVLTDSDNDPGFVYLEMQSDGDVIYNVDVEEPGSVVDFGDGWLAVPSLEKSDFHFPQAPMDWPIGSLLIGDKGPVAICVRPRKGRARFYHLDQKTVGLAAPRDVLVAVTKWTVQVKSLREAHTIVRVNAAPH